MRRRQGLLRTWAACSGLLALLLAAAAPARADEGGDALDEITPEVERVVTRALDYLASRQHPDGYWIEAIGRKVNLDYEAHRGRHVGATALACIAFMSNGSTPGRGRYGDNVSRGLRWVMDQVQDDTGFITCDDSRMYSHGFATLFLAEVYGMTQQEDIRPKLQKAVDCLVRGQNRHGGWRYRPGATDADISITVTAVQALRAARNAGIYVPSETIESAIDYVKSSHVGDDDIGFRGALANPRFRGGFWYQLADRPFQSTRTSFALTAAGVTALYGAGESGTREIEEGLRYLQSSYNRPPAYKMHQSYDYFYGHYYAVQAFFQKGGSAWQRWFPRVRDEILAGVGEEGHWEDLVGPIYATAMATIILQVPYRYLPIFER